jgi:DNA polymerase-1
MQKRANYTEKTESKTIYLIDGTAYIYRAYHAIKGLSNSKGIPTNAVFGFTRMLLKLMDERNPQYIGMFFDAKGPTFRHKIFQDYKANRPPMPDDLTSQLPYIKSITAGFNIPIIERKGYEADDLIGTVARLAAKEGFQVVMVTGDKDFVQLVSDHIIIWDPVKEKKVDLDTVKTEFKLSPHQVVDVMGLSGDSADNVPGVPGIGPKIAMTLIQTFGSLDALYNQVDSIPQKKRKENLIKYKDQAMLSRQLVKIDIKTPIEFSAELFLSRTPDQVVLSELFQDLEFHQLLKQFQAQGDLSEKEYRVILEPEQLENLILRLKSVPYLSIDTETTATDPMQARLVGISIAVEPHQAFYIPFGHDYDGIEKQLSQEWVLEKLTPILADPAIAKIGQNIKYDWMVLERHGTGLEGVTFDTMLASYLIDPARRAHSLDQIALSYLGHTTIKYEEVAGKGKNAVPFNMVHLDKAVPYACEDADMTFMAHKLLSEKLTEVGLNKLMETVEMPLVPVLKKMEMTGICVDQSKLLELSKQFEHQLDQLVDQIHALAGERFNINSSQQLGAILFEKLGLPVQKKTRKKTAFSTDVGVLTTLAEYHELPQLILRHRTLSKLKSTYTDALLEMIHPETGRIHTSFNQTVAATGRLSSSDPNLQNIPIRTEEGRQIRAAFVPRKGWIMLSADYSQIELRLLAHCADDDILIEAFNNEEDIHTRTAAEIFQVPPEFLDQDLRRQAKVINFGIIYGMGAFRLSKELDISQKMAKTYIDNYFSRYLGVKTFIDRTITCARKTGYTTTLLGRIRPLPDINSKNHNLRQFAERTAVNTPIQGTAADLIKLAMIQLDKAIVKADLKSAMLLSVHDEIILEVPCEELDQIKTIVKKEMEGIWQLKVPLKVNLDTGSNWSEAH